MPAEMLEINPKDAFAKYWEEKLNSSDAALLRQEAGAAGGSFFWGFPP